MKPIFLDIEEHHKICECPLVSGTSESHPYVAATTSFTPDASVPSSSTRSMPIGSQTGRCGVVPIPAPLVFNQPEADQNQEDVQIDQAQVSDAVALSLPTPNVNIIDYSMSNAWFPGHVGGVSFAKMSFGNGGSNLKRDKIVCAVDFRAPDVRSALVRPEESECLALGGRRQQPRDKMDAYVYETYDPEKMSTHRGMDMGNPTSNAGTNTFTPAPKAAGDCHQCPRCIQREELIRLERKKAEEHSKMMLDRGLRAYGRGGDWDRPDEEVYYNEEGGEEEMQDVDVTALDIDLGRLDREAGHSGSASQMDVDDNDDEEEEEEEVSYSSSPMTSFGDDLPDGEPGGVFRDPLSHETSRFERTRRPFDKCRIGVECRGVGDIVLSGEVSLCAFRMFGRCAGFVDILFLFCLDGT